MPDTFLDEAARRVYRRLLEEMTAEERAARQARLMAERDRLVARITEQITLSIPARWYVPAQHGEPARVEERPPTPYMEAVEEVWNQLNQDMARREEAAIIGQDGVMRHRSQLVLGDTPYNAAFWGVPPNFWSLDDLVTPLDRNIVAAHLTPGRSARPVQGCLFDDLLDPKPGA